MSVETLKSKRCICYSVLDCPPIQICIDKLWRVSLTNDYRSDAGSVISQQGHIGCVAVILEGKYVVSHLETGIAQMQLTNCELASLSFVVF